MNFEGLSSVFTGGRLFSIASARTRRGRGCIMVTKIVGIVLFLFGSAFFYTSKIWVRKFNIAEKMKAPHEDEYNEEELRTYKDAKAQLYVKFLALAMMLPGIIFIVIGFK
jgi:hypothetical protein